MRRWLHVGSACLLIGWFASRLAPTIRCEDFHGTVIAAETARPLEILVGPEFTIFKPGLAPYPRGYLTPGIKERVDRSLAPIAIEDRRARLSAGMTIPLPELHGRDELRLFADPTGIGVALAPHEAIPVTIRLINEHRRSLGLESYGMESVR
jgi:hypothetical protein